MTHLKVNYNMSIQTSPSTCDTSLDEPSQPQDAFLGQLLFAPTNNHGGDESSQFNEHMATILFGMGLEQNEVLLFREHNIGLEKFLELTDEDLQYIGIQVPNKKSMLLNGIHNFKSNKTKSRQKKVKMHLQEFSSNNAITVLTNTSNHLCTLCKTTPYIQHRLRHTVHDQYLNDSVSAKHTLVTVAEKAIQQAEQLCKQLQSLQKNIEKLRVHDEGKRKRSRNIKFLAVLATTTTLITIVLWKFPKVL